MLDAIPELTRIVDHAKRFVQRLRTYCDTWEINGNSLGEICFHCVVLVVSRIAGCVVVAAASPQPAFLKAQPAPFSPDAQRVLSPALQYSLSLNPELLRSHNQPRVLDEKLFILKRRLSDYTDLKRVNPKGSVLSAKRNGQD